MYLKPTHLLVLGVCVYLTMGQVAAADIRDVVRQLRGEPMSLFDWGMYRLESDLQRVRRDQRDFLRVTYDQGPGKILVDAMFVVLTDEIDAVSARAACYTRHHAIKLMFGVIDTSGLHFAPASDYRLGLKFSHQDPDALDPEPDVAALGRELMEAVSIRVGISSQVMEFPFSPDQRCSGDLMSQEVGYDPDSPS